MDLRDLREIYKERFFYYVLVPVILSIWPIWLLGWGLPGAKSNLQREIKDYNEAEKLISELLELDPQRIDYAKAKSQADEFDYTTAVDQASRLCRILPTDYKLSSGPLRNIKGGQKTQDASITIERIDIERLAKFLSVMRLRWVNLQCTNLTLVKIKGEKNLWKADIRFIYYQ